jgi:hypothetical protein
VLLDAEVTGEGKIIPTLAFAARLWESAYLQHIRDQLVKASQDPERWLELRDRFINSFSSLEALEVMNGVLVVRQIPISIHSAVNEADVVEEVSIDVFRRSVQPKAVAAFYKKSLRSHGISYNTDRGDVSYQVYPNYIRVTVRPENRWIDLVGKHRVYPKMETQQQSFPPPQVIESMYAAVKGSISRKPPDGFAYVLAGNERGPEAEADNLVSACVAWYVGNRGRLIQQGGLKPKVAQVLNEHLLEPCGRDTLPETGWDSSEPIWRNTKKWSQAILRVDHVLRDTYGSLGLGSDKFF